MEPGQVVFDAFNDSMNPGGNRPHWALMDERYRAAWAAAELAVRESDAFTHAAIDQAERDQERFDAGYKAGYEAAPTQWVPVEEQLPEDDEPVLATSRHWGVPCICAYEQGGWDYYGGGRVNDTITHWMPLPRAPK